MSWLSDYQYRKKVSISRPSGLVSNHQMKVVVGEGTPTTMLVNGHFETTAGWTAGQGTIASVAGGIAGNCLEITRSSGTEQWATTDPLPFILIAGETYTLEGYVKSGTSGDTLCGIYLYNNDWSWYTSKQTTTSDTWTKISVTFVATVTTVSCACFKLTDTAGTILFDSVQLYRGSVYCEGHCLPSFDDVRFTTSDGETLLDYWIESTTGTTPDQLSNIWVEFDSIATSATDFYIYYGKADATAVSNGNNTFLFFDDFERGINGDAVGGIWTASATSTISTSQSYGGTRSCKLTGDAITRATLSASCSHANTQAFTMRVYKNNACRILNFSHGDGSYRIATVCETDESIKYLTGSAWVDTTFNCSVNSWFLIEINNINFTAGTYDILYNGSIIKSSANMNADAFDTDTIGIYGGLNVGEDAYIDNVIVRNWLSTGPISDSWGPEESFDKETTVTLNISANIMPVPSAGLSVLYETPIALDTITLLSPNIMPIMSVDTDVQSMYITGGEYSFEDVGDFTVLFGTRTLYWVCPAASGAWNDPYNWSLSSGGAGNNNIPRNGDTVIFDIDRGFDVSTVDMPTQTATLADFIAEPTIGNLIIGADDTCELLVSSGIIDFYNTTLINITASGGATFNALYLDRCVDGGGNSNINFVGDQWYIKSNADYVELHNTTLTDSHAVGEISFRAYTYNNNVDNGNNTHWIFTGPTEIIDVVPNSGMYDDLVTITGVGFSDETTISFNGTPAIVDSYTPTEIITHVPYGSTTGTVFIDGNSSLHIFTVLVPIITSITPTNGPVGTEIIITGQNFYTEPVITFHNNIIATIDSYSTTQIITNVPASSSTGLVTISFDGILYYSFLFTLSWNIVCSNGVINVHHTAIYNSIASGGATFKSFTSNGCIDGGGNIGWIFRGYDPEEHKQSIKDPLTKFQITIIDATGKSGT